MEPVTRSWIPRSCLIERGAASWQATSGRAQAKSLDDDYTILSTIHSAKSQEWRSVRILNVVDGCIPSDMATRTSDEIEEERRLLYVAMTQAKDDLDLIMPQRFYTHQPRPHSRSRPRPSRALLQPRAPSVAPRAPATRRGHIYSCKRFAAFLKRSPETGTCEDIRHETALHQRNVPARRQCCGDCRQRSKSRQRASSICKSSA